jgi:hypothetical protein
MIEIRERNEHIGKRNGTPAGYNSLGGLTHIHSPARLEA